MENTSLKGDAPTNAVGTGQVAGIGFGPNGEPPIKKSVIMRRFAGKHVFEVSPDYFHACRMGKQKHHRYSRYVGEDDTGEAIREFGRTNPGVPIILQCSRTGMMLYLKYGKY